MRCKRSEPTSPPGASARPPAAPRSCWPPAPHGKRHALPTSRILLHQPWGGTGQGQSIDIKIRAEEIVRQRRLMERILAEHTGQAEERIHEDLDRDFILAPEAALAYGVVDHIG